jgi:FkbM family methyltransferase
VDVGRILFGPSILGVPRWRLAANYAAMRLGRVRHGVGPGRARIFGCTVEAADYSTLMYLYDEIFVQQEYAFETTAPRPRIIDAGANIGMTTLFFKMICPGARIDAYEPAPASFRILERNIGANRLTDVRLHNVALAGHAGRTALFTRPGEHTSLIASTRPQRGGSERTEVETVTLSSQIEDEVDLLKMDVEGSEMEILEEVAASGKMALIREILVEYHHNIGGERGLSPFLALLEGQGFGYRLKAAPRRLRDSHGGDQDVLVWAYRAPGVS